MEQQQFRVTFSLSTKLLSIVGSFLFLTIVFLSVAAVFLMTDDKQAYTFQTKAIEAGLAGRDFMTIAEHTSDTLRLALANVDLTKPLDGPAGDALRSLVLNQSDLSGIAVGYVNNQTGQVKLINLATQPTMTESSKAPATTAELTTELSSEWLKTALPQLNNAGLGFVNLSKTDRSPLLAVIVEDRAATPTTDGTPATIGLLPLTKLASQLIDLDLTIVTKTGWLLFDTNAADLYARGNLAEDPLFKASISNQIESGTLDYVSPKGRFLGGYSKPGFDLVVLSRANWKNAMRASYTLTEKFILLGCMAIGLGIVFTILFSKTLTAPLNRLYESTRQVAEGNFDIEMKTTVHDEIGALTSSFNVMSTKIRELLKTSVEKALLEKEIDIASTVQKTLIPENVYDAPGIQIRAHYQAASSCGGDWWGQFLINDKLVIGVADATGHGLSSALITASARSCFSMIQRQAERDPAFVFSPSAMLDYANRVIFDCANGNIMMTFFMAVIDLGKMTVTYANAAHNPPWIFNRNENGYKLNSLVSSGLRLGETQQLAKPIDEKSIAVGEGDVFFLYTDGLTEGKNLADEMFGKKKVRQIVERNLAVGPDQIVSELMTEFMAYNEGKALDDDVTIVTIRLTSMGKPA